MKTCPFCAEEIQEAAIVCKHCGRDLSTGNKLETYSTLVAKEQALDRAITEYANAGWVIIWRTLKAAQLNFPKKFNWRLFIFLIVISVFIFEILPMIYLLWWLIKKPESINLSVADDGQILLNGDSYRKPAQPAAPKTNVVKSPPPSPKRIAKNRRTLLIVGSIVITLFCILPVICLILSSIINGGY